MIGFDHRRSFHLTSAAAITITPVLAPLLNAGLLFWYGQVPERLKGADCKSAGASLRWFETSPVHHLPYFPLKSLGKTRIFVPPLFPLGHNCSFFDASDHLSHCALSHPFPICRPGVKLGMGQFRPTKYGHQLACGRAVLCCDGRACLSHAVRRDAG
jgi:hypothetical protein